MIARGAIGSQLVWVRIGFVVVLVQLWGQGHGFEVYVPTPLRLTDAAKVVKALAKGGV